MNDPRTIAAAGSGVDSAATDGVEYPDPCHFGDGMISASDAEIQKNNRLALLRQIHARRQQEKEMAKKKEEQCAVCGQEKNLRSHLDRAVCSSCAFVQTAITNRPEAVVQAFFDLGKGEFVSSVPVDAGVPTSDTVDEYRALEDKYRALRETCTELEKYTVVLQQIMDACHPGLGPRSEAYWWAVANLPEFVRGLDMANDALREVIDGKDFEIYQLEESLDVSNRALEKYESTTPPATTDSAILDLAVNFMKRHGTEDMGWFADGVKKLREAA